MDFPKTTLELRMHSLNTELFLLPPPLHTKQVGCHLDNGKYTFFFVVVVKVYRK